MKPTFKQMYYPKFINDKDVVKNNCDLTKNMVLTGPNASGKTTTLYSCLSTIDRLGRNVVTVEDPVEYRLKGVHQTQVDENLGLTFAGGLRAILRQDPDVIMVGECRDPETAQMAV